MDMVVLALTMEPMEALNLAEAQVVTAVDTMVVPAMAVDLAVVMMATVAPVVVMAATAEVPVASDLVAQADHHLMDPVCLTVEAVADHPLVVVVVVLDLPDLPMQALSYLHLTPKRLP